MLIVSDCTLQNFQAECNFLSIQQLSMKLFEIINFYFSLAREGPKEIYPFRIKSTCQIILVKPKGWSWFYDDGLVKICVNTCDVSPNNSQCENLTSEIFSHRQGKRLSTILKNHSFFFKRRWEKHLYISNSMNKNKKPLFLFRLELAAKGEKKKRREKEVLISVSGH